MGRKKTNIKNQARVIDIDILDNDKLLIKDRFWKTFFKLILFLLETPFLPTRVRESERN